MLLDCSNKYGDWGSGGEECRGGDREHLLLLCDGCDLATHTTCLTPPLSQVVYFIICLLFLLFVSLFVC